MGYATTVRMIHATVWRPRKYHISKRKKLYTIEYRMYDSINES